MNADAEVISYTKLKAIVAKKNLAWQHHETDKCYELFAVDNTIRYDSCVFKRIGGTYDHIKGLDETQNDIDLADFEANYKAHSNWAQGVRPYPFATGDFDFTGDGVFATVPFGTTADVDIVVAVANIYVNGGEFYCKDAVVGDYIEAMVIDIDNVLGAGANFVVKQWITKWYIIPDTIQKLSTPYAGAVPTGLYMRAKYHSTGGTDVKVIGNYYFHKAI